MQRLAVITLLLCMMACTDSPADHPPAAWLHGTHFVATDNYLASGGAMLACDKDGRSLGVVEKGTWWWARTPGHVIGEYQDFWSAANALQLYVEKNDDCGGEKR